MSAPADDPGRPLLSVLHLQAGGCGGCALEVAALRGAGRALLDAGFVTVETPRHADVLLVSGCPTRNLGQAIDAAWAAMPGPKQLVAVGDCAIDGGPFRDSYAVPGGLGARHPVAVAIPGCPPTPDAILDGLCVVLAAPDGHAPVMAEPATTSPVSSEPLVPGPSVTDPPAPRSSSPELPPPRALLPAAPRHPLAGGDSSAG